LALMMGRMVCITNPAAAAARDAALLAQRATQAADPPPPAAGGLGPGCWRDGTAGAGGYFPQARAGAAASLVRLDDIAGPGAWLVTRERGVACDGLAVLAIEDPAIAPFAPDLCRWLDRHGAEAVLVRPDRYVFATGPAKSLHEAWTRALTGGGH
jgi:3-(3-hydroxy-phenyl)propionate hydroxylase